MKKKQEAVEEEMEVQQTEGDDVHAVNLGACVDALIEYHPSEAANLPEGAMVSQSQPRQGMIFMVSSLHSVLLCE